MAAQETTQAAPSNVAAADEEPDLFQTDDFRMYCMKVRQNISGVENYCCCWLGSVVYFTFWPVQHSQFELAVLKSFQHQPRSVPQ